MIGKWTIALIYASNYVKRTITQLSKKKKGFLTTQHKSLPPPIKCITMTTKKEKADKQWKRKTKQNQEDRPDNTQQQW